MCLDDKERKANGDRVLVGSLEEFRSNFGVFSEASLLNLGTYIIDRSQPSVYSI